MVKKDKFKRMLKNPMVAIGAIMFLLVILVVIFAPAIAPHSYTEQNADVALTAPCREYPWGTDQYGRCIFSRVIYGSRIALSVGIIAVVIETLIGVTLGVISGYYGKKIDKVVQFITDATWAIPPIILAMAIVLMLGSSATNVAIAVAVVSWAQFTKIIRTKVMAIKALPYIEAISYRPSSYWQPWRCLPRFYRRPRWDSSAWARSSRCRTGAGSCRTVFSSSKRRHGSVWRRDWRLSGQFSALTS